MNIYNPIAARVTHFKQGQNNAPEVPYHDVAEFLELQREFVRQYTWLITDVLDEQFHPLLEPEPPASDALIWTDRDQIINGMAYFPRLVTQGQQYVHDMTKKLGIEWCESVAVLMSNYITLACRSHARCLMQWPVSPREDMFKNALQQEMVTTMYESLRLLDHLYEQSFVDIWTVDNIVSHTFTARQWRIMQEAFLMGTQKRLGVKSALSKHGIIPDDVIQMIFNLTTQCTALQNAAVAYAVFSY